MQISQGKPIEPIILRATVLNIPSSASQYSALIRHPNLHHVFHVEVSLTSWLLGMEPNEMCMCLDHMYDTIHDREQGLDALLPSGWRIRFTANGFRLLPQLLDIYRSQPDVLLQLAERLAQDLKQPLNQPWPNLPLDEVIARFIMRLITLCTVMAHVTGDATCMESLGPIFPQLSIVPSVGLPSLSSALSHYRTSLRATPSYSSLSARPRHI